MLKAPLRIGWENLGSNTFQKNRKQHKRIVSHKVLAPPLLRETALRTSGAATLDRPVRLVGHGECRFGGPTFAIHPHGPATAAE